MSFGVRDVRVAVCLLAIVFVSTLLMPAALAARVVRIEIVARADVLDGRSFGAAGPYERLVGRVYFEFDPDDPANARIVDLSNAPRNERGMVEAWANFMILQPKDLARGSGTALLEVSNRGGKASLSYFNGGRSSRDPTTAEHFGDGFLMRQGLTVIWVGWQFDVPPEDESLLRLHVPIAEGQDGPFEGLVRADWVVGSETTTLALGHRGHRAYPVSHPSSNQVSLTVRDGREERRRVVPRSEWRFARETEDGVVGSLTHVYAPGGFAAGKIYELVYPAQDPRVVGLGLAAIRDMISYAKHSPDSPFPVQRGIGIGISQTGRFLRHFLYQGFNEDEDGRKAFDGLMVHTAGGGRGSFNHRFGQPSRDAHRFSAFFYPTDLFPFSGRTQADPETGQEDGLLANLGSEMRPKVFYTNTGYEYWGRAASLLHTSPDGGRDIELLPEERIYHLASAQHFVDRFPPTDQQRISEPGGPDAYRGNPLYFLVNMRALLVRMMEWTRTGQPPPASRYPTLADRDLVWISGVFFPQIPGVAFPGVIHLAYRAAYGPEWSDGIVTWQPPELGPPFPSLVSQVDEFGNERAGVRNVELRAPLATYAPWSLRVGLPGPQEELADFRGTFLPFPWTDQQRIEWGDPRLSVESLYESRAAYQDAARAAAEELVSEGFLLQEDVDRVVERATGLWDWLAAAETGSGPAP